MPDNSIILSADQQDAYRLDAELKHNAQAVIGGIIEIGRCLKEINDRKLYEYLGFNGLAEYAEAAVGLKERAAYNYITAYETYGEQGLQQYGQLGITKLVALAQLNEEDRTEMLESGKADELSTRKLNDEIKRLKGENDQLRFELDEAQRPVVASLTDEEKDEIRKEAEKKARMDAESEILSVKTELKKQNKEALEKIDTAEKARAAAEKEIMKLRESIDEQNEVKAEQAEKIAELMSQLEAATLANAELQANAKAPVPVPSGNKELLKYHFEGIKTAYIGAVEVLGRFDANEREKYKTALIKIAGDIKSAVENM